MILESMALLVVASVIATVVCYYLQKTALPQIVGAETMQRINYTYAVIDGNVNLTKTGMGIVKQDFINFGISFLLLAFITFVAVWYPAKQASDTQPAETLHEE